MSTTEKQLDETIIVRAADSQVSTTLNDEVVILNHHSGVYYGLNEVGREIWDSIQEPQPIQVLIQALIDAYEITPEQGRDDVLALLNDLHKNGLITLEDVETPSVD